MVSTWTGDVPRRREGDRRQQHQLLDDWRWAYRGRRRTTRRVGEARTVDLHPPLLMAMCVGIMLLSGVDATATLLLLGTGAATEANPFMRWIIDHDVQTAVNIKIVLTGAALVFLVACSGTLFLRRVPVRWILGTVLGIYTTLVAYEMVLLVKAGHL